MNLERFSASVLLLWTVALAGQTPADDPEWAGRTWQSLNPGGGGNIQGVFTDPSTPGRLYLASDMEGCYRSDDFGEHWTYLGADLSDSYVNWIEAEAADPARVYAGTFSGLEISDSAGLHWRRVAGIDDCIGQIVIDPRRPQQVIALPGERYRWGAPNWDPKRFEESAALGPWGSREFYLSRDRGVSWQTIKYDDGEGRRDVFSAEVSPAGTWMIANLGGIYLADDPAEGWAQIASPPQAGDCFGSAFSADGSVIYAAFRVPSADGSPAIVTTSRTAAPEAAGVSHLFARRTAGGEWFDLSAAGEGFRLSEQGPTCFWRPRVDATETGERHRIAIGTFRPQHGLWEVEVTWSDQKPAARWTQVLQYEWDHVFNKRILPWDRGWESWRIIGEDYRYAPAAWLVRSMIATGGQTLFMTDRSKGDFASRWRPLYTRRVGEIDGIPTYRTRGFESVFVFDADADRSGRYVVQSVGDNCLLESFDGGYSFTMAGKPGDFLSSRSNSARVIQSGKGPVVLAHAAVGWGAGAQTGTLYARRLNTMSPKTPWLVIGGGEQRLAGLPNLQFNQIQQDPHEPRRVYVPTLGEGIYAIEDIDATLDAADAGRPLPPMSRASGAGIGGPTHTWYASTAFTVDPQRGDVLYGGEVMGRIWRGQWLEGRWQWQQVLDRAGDGGFAAWAAVPGHATWLVSTQPAAEGGAWEIVLSRDEGKVWQPLVGAAQITELARQKNPAWYHAGLVLKPTGLLGDGESLIAAFTTPVNQGARSLGLYRFRLSSDGKVIATEDLTADLPWAYPVRARIIRHPDGAYLYLATRGAGLWRRALP